MVSKVSAASSLPPAVIVTGPTAAGKTALVEALYDRFPIRLISVDSVQIYRGLNIGSAKPSEDDLVRYPHALIDQRWPEESYSVADFVADAEQEMRAAARSGLIPVLVGGTVLYLRALLYGLDPLPSADALVRERLAERASRAGWPALHAELAQRDPQTAATIRPSDSQRIQRALEVLEMTGRGLAAHHSGPRLPRFQTRRFVLAPADRSELHDRIGRRLREMLKSGLIEEVEQLRLERTQLSEVCPSMRAVGYRQVWQFLDDKIPREALLSQASAATRQLAKRQLTWLRKFNDALWYDPARSSSVSMIGSQVDEFRNTEIA
ncbi:MAG: tRNA (adenosine(37)-N6)-dimethylallyltransferase MiaA [Wenzhouxiangella sp.]|nr:tRNA (adenosine(37)-N6)-dimethylallyltransferase MiaA [Wenzhouxiangella sp.]